MKTDNLTTPESEQEATHSTIADFATPPVHEICWNAMEHRLAILEQPELVHRAGNALPALLFIMDRFAGSDASQPVQYIEIAKKLGCSLSTVKKWIADLEGHELVRRTSCGKSGVILELLSDALGESADLRRVRELVKSLLQQVASIRQVLDSSLAATMASLNKLDS